MSEIRNVVTTFAFVEVAHVAASLCELLLEIKSCVYS